MEAVQVYCESLSGNGYMDSASKAESESGKLKEIVRGPYLLTGRSILTDELATKIVQMMRVAPENAPKGTLAGRGYAGVKELPSIGRVFVKQYAHGGLLRKITGGKFLCGGLSRSRAEFDMLEQVREFGVNAPRPLICVTKGSFFYETWLMMEEIENSRNLVEVSKQDIDLLHDSMRKVAEQVLLLIQHKVFHVDLHPGNVLISDNGDVHIVDFDKARLFSGSAQKLRELYLRRWRRAVIKHELTPVLTELMSLSLRSYND